MAYTAGVRIVSFLTERKLLIPHLSLRQGADIALEIDRLLGHPDSALSFEEVLEKIKPLSDRKQNER